MKIENMQKFLPVAAIAEAVGRTTPTIQSWINEGSLEPDAIMLQKNRRSVALFHERRVKDIEELLQGRPNAS
jgi:hypothetical protein